MAVGSGPLDLVDEVRSEFMGTINGNDGLLDDLGDDEEADPIGDDLAIGDHEIDERYRRWRPLYALTDEIQEEQLRHLVIESIRIRRCVSHESSVRQILIDRAKECWVLDREAEAADLINKLHRNPYRWRGELLRKVAGCRWMIAEWRSLLAALDQQPNGWDDRQRSRALDLLGVSTLFRAGGTPLDLPADALRQRVVDEIAQLTAIRDTQLEPAERTERELVAAGQVLPADRQVMAIRRFEAGCRRRFNELSRALQPFRIDPSRPQSQPGRKPRTTDARPSRNETASSFRSIMENSKQQRSKKHETEQCSDRPWEDADSFASNSFLFSGLDWESDQDATAWMERPLATLVRSDVVDSAAEAGPRNDKAAADRRARRKAAAKARKRNRR